MGGNAPRRTLRLLVTSMVVPLAACLDNGLARTPQMGWNSWNHFGCDVSDTLVRDTAEALLSSGLAAAGYRYVNLDDCWQVNRTEGTGEIVADPTRFPHGMAALASHIHSRGLLFGLYSDAGNFTCMKRPGGLGHESVDAATYAKWEVDYLKYDNCYADWNPQPRYEAMRDALNATGRPILFSMCEWGVKLPALWAPGVANSWRTTVDINGKWDSMLLNIDINNLFAKYAGPGGWNDPDMLEVGNGDFTGANAMARSHFAIWCVAKAPLLLGNDLRGMDAPTLALLTHDEAIAINQDALGVQASVVASDMPLGSARLGECVDKNKNCAAWAKRGECERNPAYMWMDCEKACNRCHTDGLQTWAGKLSGGRWAVALWNRSNRTQAMTAGFEAVGVPAGRSVTVRDVFARRDVGVFSAKYSQHVGAYDTALLLLTPAPGLRG